MFQAPLADRFWSKVHKTNTCWLWTGSKSDKGYGKLYSGGPDGTTVRANRVSWELHFGPIPKGKHVLHECDNPSCVRPSHLFLGSHLQNMQDRDKKNRRIAIKGENHVMAKLCDEDIRTIRQLGNNKIGQRKIGKQFKVSQRTVWRIIHRKSWAHVPDVV